MIRKGIGVATGVCVAVLMLLSAFPALGTAALFPFELQIPENGTAGSTAGRMSKPRGIAYSSVSHRIYVADTGNRRVDVFSAWGEFLFAFGWGVKDGLSKPETCTSLTGCQRGIAGSGAGQFGEVPAKSQYIGPTGITVDQNGDIFVLDLGNFRVQKFDASGNFLLMVGGEVNKTMGTNLCTKASNDICGAGRPGSGPSEFSIENVLDVTGDYLATAPDGAIFVADRDRIQQFEPSGAFRTSCLLPEPGNPGAMAIDPESGALYFAYAQPLTVTQPNVLVLTASCEEIGEPLAAERPTAVATDRDGHVFVVNDPPGAGNLAQPRIIEFDSTGNILREFAEGDPLEELAYGGLDAGVVTPAGGTDIYVTRFNPVGNDAIGNFHIYGAVPDPDTVGPPPKVPPGITDQFAESVGFESAVVRADINPQFWDDTTYFVEYGTVDCAVGPCRSSPVPPGALLTEQVTGNPVRTPGLLLTELEPGTIYHYRFVAESGGGGPAIGGDRTFATPALAPPAKPCPGNDTFRMGAGAALPDCRAYEMVTPIDKNGANIATLTNGPELPARRDQSASNGLKITYSAYKAFGDAQSSPYSSQYLAVRDPAEGWGNHGISPPREGPSLTDLSGLDSQFKAFTNDLCSGWLLQDTALLVTPDAVAGYPDLYRQGLCGGEGNFEAVTRIQPPVRTPRAYLFEVQGYSADGSRTVFRANDKLTANAPNGDAAKVYSFLAGQLRFVCLLPNNAAVNGCSLGTSGGKLPSEARGTMQNAVSRDGQRIYWTAAEEGSAKLYVRVGGTQTVAVSKGPATFWGASADGARAIFAEGGALYQFELGVDAPEAAEQIAGGLVGVVGMSEEANRVYFVSTEDLDGAGPAAAGRPNLYLRDGETLTFVATLLWADVSAPLSPTVSEPYRHSARVSADGNAVAFISKAGLTGQDSIELNSGEPVSQVYLYNVSEGTLSCPSCNRSGARPRGRDLQEFYPFVESKFWASGFLTTTEGQLYQPRALSEDGSRLFFQSFDALVPRDINDQMDVYQWEAKGSGTCQDEEGCVDLISSGQNSARSDFIDANADGSDVFFTTVQSLASRDPGMVDIYDARVGGGFPSPPLTSLECEGESCQKLVPAPDSSSPASATFVGPGNPAPRQRVLRRCPKGKHKAKHKAKVVCVKNKRRHHKNHNRRGGH
jgi:DNA-binding beta-propeller fold protein YncE